MGVCYIATAFERYCVREAVSTAVYSINRSPNAHNTNVTPSELELKKNPSLKYLYVFGSHGYANIDTTKRTKVDSKFPRTVAFSSTEANYMALTCAFRKYY